jgi:hypothetical protein
MNPRNNQYCLKVRERKLKVKKKRIQKKIKVKKTAKRLKYHGNVPEIPKEARKRH